MSPSVPMRRRPIRAMTARAMRPHGPPPRSPRRPPGPRAGAADGTVQASPPPRRADRSRPVCLPAPPGGGRPGGGGLAAPAGGPHLHRPHAPSMDGGGGGHCRQHRSQRRHRPAQGPLWANDGWAADLPGAPVRGRLGVRQRDPLGRVAGFVTGDAPAVGGADEIAVRWVHRRLFSVSPGRCRTPAES